MVILNVGVEEGHQEEVFRSHSQQVPHHLLHCIFVLGEINTVKKRLAVILSPARMSLTKLSLAGNNLIIPGQGEFVSEIPAGDRKIIDLFYSVN